MITQKINLNLVPGGIMPRVNVSQYDFGSRSIEITLYNGASTFTIPTGATIYIQGTKKDNRGFQYKDVPYSGSVVYANVTQQMTVFEDEVKVELVIISEDEQEQLATANFILNVEPAALIDDVVVSDTDIPIIQTLPQAMQEVRDSVAEMQDDLLIAESWATGTKDGEPVPSTDPTYHNNSKYYAETVSQGKVEDAEAWAVGKRNGQDVPSTDPTYHNNAAYWAEVSSSQTLHGLTDVSVPNPSNGQALIYESSSGLWKAKNVAAKMSELTDTTISSPSAGQPITYDDINQKWENGGTIPVANGGTGQTSLQATRNAMGLGNTTGALPVANGGTGATTAADARTNLGVVNCPSGLTSGYVRTGQKSGTTIGDKATAEGYNTTASSSYSHAEGYNTTANSGYAHAEGSSTTASGLSSHAEGYNTTANSSHTHAEGANTIASAEEAHAEGASTTASAPAAHAEGSNTTASGGSSHAEGGACTASGSDSHAGGYRSAASGDVSFSHGWGTTASAYAQTVFGAYNVDYPGQTTNHFNNSAYFIIGKGSESTKANCFRVATTAVYGAGAYNSSGADYAELFEWLDSNKKNEDRVGKFVTLKGNKIKLATDKDDYILGIVSGNPSVCGDVYDDQWHGMYLTDVFGRPIFEEVEVEAEYEERENPETGEIEQIEIIPAHTETRQKLNPEYNNPSGEGYEGRTERPEWDAVGLVGKLVAIDDGTCEVDGWAKCNKDSIATKSTERTKYRVMERIDDTHIRVMIL